MTNKANNALIHFNIARLLDTILVNKWYMLSVKDSWNQIYLANYLIELYQVVKGTFLGLRLLKHTRDILMGVLSRKDLELKIE